MAKPDPDSQDQESTLLLFGGLAAFVIVALLVVVFVVAPMLSAELAPGMGVQTAAIIAFVVTLVVIVIMTVAAGDGLLGEIQFTLPAFFVFFLLIWLLVAWVF